VFKGDTAYTQGLKYAGSQLVADPALSKVPGLFVYSFTVSPVAVIEPDIYGLNNETTERRRTACSANWYIQRELKVFNLHWMFLIVCMHTKYCTSSAPVFIIC